MTKEFWNERYKQADFAYGTLPNQQFKEFLTTIPVGRLLLPAEGEGRNAVFAAKMGWQVDAFDMSESGRQKAIQLAIEENVMINYIIDDISSFSAEPNSYDCIAFVYAHLPSDERKISLKKFQTYLKPGGKFFVLGFSKNQLGKDSGGPKNAEMLYSIEEIKIDFSDLHINIIEQFETEIEEGIYHKGKASLLKLVATKTSL